MIFCDYLNYYCIGHVHISYSVSQRVVMNFPNFKEDFASGITTLELEDFISLIDVFSDVSGNVSQS